VSRGTTPELASADAAELSAQAQKESAVKRASYDKRIAQRNAKRRSSDRLPFTRALRKLGFKRTDPDRDPLIYEQSRGVMKVTVQLWLDGKHRASNSVDGHHDKVPTDFTALEAMSAAIEVEFAAAKAKMESDENKVYRAKLIASRVLELYGVEHASAAAHDNLRRDPNQSWMDVASDLGALLTKEARL
jgi:hypothetical protein